MLLPAPPRGPAPRPLQHLPYPAPAPQQCHAEPSPVWSTALLVCAPPIFSPPRSTLPCPPSHHPTDYPRDFTSPTLTPLPCQLSPSPPRTLITPLTQHNTVPTLNTRLRTPSSVPLSHTHTTPRFTCAHRCHTPSTAPVPLLFPLLFRSVNFMSCVAHPRSPASSLFFYCARPGARPC